MSILLGLTPFIVFFVLMRLVHPLAGLSAAFAVHCCWDFANGVAASLSKCSRSAAWRCSACWCFTP